MGRYKGTVPVSIMEPDGGMRRAKSTGTGTGTVPVRGQTSLRRVGPSVELGSGLRARLGLGVWGHLFWGKWNDDVLVCSLLLKEPF